MFALLGLSVFCDKLKISSLLYIAVSLSIRIHVKFKVSSSLILLFSHASELKYLPFSSFEYIADHSEWKIISLVLCVFCAKLKKLS